MANALGLNVLFSANASGMAKGLSQVDRQLQNLGKQASQAARLFDGFASSSGAAATAQQQVATDIAFLTSAYNTGQVSAEAFATTLRDITVSAQQSAAAFAEGARITEQTATAEERRTSQLERLGQLLEQGAISEETYSRAAAEASGANAEAAAAESERAKALARAAQITAANLSPQERYDQAVEELTGHLNAGRISQETYNSAINKAAQDFAKATLAADRFDDASRGAGSGGVLQFNELSGVLAAIPGPIGNVAGRLSGLASAGEGLGRVFSGGLSQGLTSIGASVAGLVNPFTVGLAAVAAFGAGATALASSLLELDGRVEKLGNAADKLGVSFGFIQVIEEAAARSGVSFEQVNAATTRLLKTLAGADEESKAATQALDRLGLSLGDLEGLSPEDQFRAIGDALTGIEDPAKRVAAATALFGRAGAELLPFFNNLDKAATDIERFGRALDNVDRRRVDEFGDSVDAVKVATRQLGTEITLPFVGLGEGINQAAAEFLGGINSIVGPIGDVLEPVLSGLGAAFELVGVIIGGIGRTIGAVLAPIGDLAQAFGSVGEVFNDAFVDVIRYLVDASVATTEWLVSFSGVSVLADGISALSSGFDALSASLAPVAELAQRIGTVVSEAFSQLSAAVSSAISSTVGNIAEAVQAFGEFTGISGLISSFADSVTSAFNSIWDGIRNVVSQVGGFIESVVSFAENWLGIQRTVEEPIVAELDLSQPSLAATQFADEIGNAATAAAEFGEAGFQAALAYQQSLEQIAQLQADGTLTSEEAKRLAEQEKAAFESKIETLDREAEAQRTAAEEAQRAADEKIDAAKRAAQAAIDADRQMVDASIERNRIDAEFGGDSERARAAETLLAIRREQARVEQEIADARARGDQQAVFEGNQRLRQLEEAEAREDDIASGRKKARDEEHRRQMQQLDEFVQKEQQRQEDISRLNERFAERAAEIDAERIEALSQVSQQPLQIEDVRTGAGISEFLRLATGREDPAIAEYRKQLSELQKIAKEIRELGGVVDIVGAN